MERTAYPNKNAIDVVVIRAVWGVALSIVLVLCSSCRSALPIRADRCDSDPIFRLEEPARVAGFREHERTAIRVVAGTGAEALRWSVDLPLMNGPGDVVATADGRCIALVGYSGQWGCTALGIFCSDGRKYEYTNSDFADALGERQLSMNPAPANEALAFFCNRGRGWELAIWFRRLPKWALVSTDNGELRAAGEEESALASKEMMSVLTARYLRSGNSPDRRTWLAMISPVKFCHERAANGQLLRTGPVLSQFLSWYVDDGEFGKSFGAPELEQLYERVRPANASGSDP